MNFSLTCTVMYLLYFFPFTGLSHSSVDLHASSSLPSPSFASFIAPTCIRIIASISPFSLALPFLWLCHLLLRCPCLLPDCSAPCTLLLPSSLLYLLCISLLLCTPFLSDAFHPLCYLSSWLLFWSFFLLLEILLHQYSSSTSFP